MTSSLYGLISSHWDSNVIPKIQEYVTIPNQSPSYDPEWKTNNLINNATDLLFNWALSQNVEGLRAEIVREQDRTPVIFIEISGTDNVQETIMMYGHLDKQPPLTDAWETGLGPYTPVIRDGKLYGRGAADDGYSIFTALTSIKALQTQKLPHARIVVFIEASEESGSPDLDFYIEKLTPRIGQPSLIICLDSGCGNYQQLWLTTSLRGMIAASITVSVLKEGVHSGAASGIVPSSFRILRGLLDRLEDPNTGKILSQAFYVEIPKSRIEQVKRSAQTLGKSIITDLPFVDGVEAMDSDVETLLLNRTWRPTLSVIGAEGFPTLKMAGNVLRTSSSLRISVRLPPLVDPEIAKAELIRILTEDPPYHAHVSVEDVHGGPGWNSPDLEPWLERAADEASKEFYQKPLSFIGEGFSIPFMGMLSKMFPKAQFLITGVLGPQSNPHGPNEFLHIDFAKRLTCCVAQIVHQHFVQHQKSS